MKFTRRGFFRVLAGAAALVAGIRGKVVRGVAKKGIAPTLSRERFADFVRTGRSKQDESYHLGGYLVPLTDFAKGIIDQGELSVSRGYPLQTTEQLFADDGGIN